MITLLEPLLRLFNDPDKTVIPAAWKAVDAIIKKIPTGDLPKYIADTRECIKSMTEADQGKKLVDFLPGLCVLQGVQPLATMFLSGLTNSKVPEVREQAALGLGEIISLTTNEALKPHVIKITGPLIRVVGDRSQWQVKAAILNTLRYFFYIYTAHTFSASC